MANELIKNPFHLSHSADPKPLLTMARTLIKRKGFSLPQEVQFKNSFWKAEKFELQNVTCFQGASSSQKDRIVHLCSIQLLEEAYFIEKAGMTFTAKMSLLAESVEERMLYSLFSSEEAAHFAGISLFLPDSLPTGDPEKQPFLQLLSDAILNGERLSLIFLVQVVLEGWGLHHYRGLANDCQYDPLKQTLLEIVRDEAGHHGSGMILFNEKHLTSAQREDLLDLLVRFLSMIQVGPQSVLSVLEQEVGGFSQSQRRQVLEELRGEFTTFKKLGLIRDLMQKSSSEVIVSQLEKWGAFVPLCG